MSNPTINITTVIDASPLGRFRMLTITLCGLVALLDGFDTQAIAFVASAMADHWGTDVALFGPVFAAGLFGLMIGALVMGPIADRYGRKKIIVGSCVWFGAFALLTPLTSDIPSLIAVRFMTGLGLGAAMPNIIALTSEYAPRHRCTMLVTLMFCGFPLGAVLGGLVSTKLIPLYGWHAVFILGGVAPLVVACILMLWLPESIRFLVAQGGRPASVTKICNAINPGGGYSAGQQFSIAEEKLEGLPIKHLFTRGRMIGTLALWVVFFSNLLLIYFLINWLPSVLQKSGMPIERAIIGTVMLNAGGIAGGLILSRVIDKIGPYLVLTVTYLVAVPLVAVIGRFDNLVMLMGAILVAGFCVLGAQFGINSLAANFYPTSARSSGVGWALGIGRIGSIIGPLVGGTMLTLAWTTESIFLAAALPALLSAVAVYVIGMLAGKSSEQPGPQTATRQKAEA
jgi:AAHS family 4-hydroxybenzoate transporter-like MFS transporter